jgi:flagellar biosynthetic protein FlhB
MANDDKTEKPTDRRRREARQSGQVAKSADLNGAGVLIAGLIAVTLMAPAIVSLTGQQMANAFGAIARPASVVSQSGVNSLLSETAGTLLGTVAPIMGICLAAAVILNVAQVGFRPSPRAVVPRFSKINPINGVKNLFGPRIAFDTAKSLVKVAVVGVIIVLALLPDLTQLGASVGTTPTALTEAMSAGVTGIVERGAVAYFLIGLVDYIWQRRRTEKSLKMSKQEVKEEFKRHQLPPEVRSAIRRRQVQAARARMMAAVPKADVIVTNPTHFAVALSYDGTLPAPVLLAKGQDLVALQIRKIAEEHEIPIVPDPPLARELHHTVEIGQMIPAELYAAVAQVLAFVYRLAARKKRGA